MGKSKPIMRSAMWNSPEDEVSPKEDEQATDNSSVDAESDVGTPEGKVAGDPAVCHPVALTEPLGLSCSCIYLWSDCLLTSRNKLICAGVFWEGRSLNSSWQTLRCDQVCCSETMSASSYLYLWKFNNLK